MPDTAALDAAVAAEPVAEAEEETFAPAPDGYTVYDLAEAAAPKDARPPGAFQRWLLEGFVRSHEAPHAKEGAHKPHPWWQVVCLTGVDYFSTLGYQPGIAALAAGALSPFATLVLVLLTLFGALPMYNRVAAESPHGDGSISMLEKLLQWWQGKLFVLALIGFAATGFIITITLSAADATAHVVENPYTSFLHGYEVPVTLGLIALLGAVFLKGFKEAVGIAVVLVALYLGLNALVIGRGLMEIAHRPELLADWKTRLFTAPSGGQVGVGALVLGSLLVFPRLALGLSGFETGVVVMPLVKGDPTDTEEKPAGRIRNTRKLLAAAALIMSAYLLTSSVVTTLLIPPAAFKEGGDANGRALAYLAHEMFHPALATLYDVSTILILWFAGASAMAGLLNIVPRYLPRYGMAPEWTRAVRPLVLVFTAACFLVTLAFRAGVEEQAGAYATGVLALMTSATVAVTLSARRAGQRAAAAWFAAVSLIFIYTTAVNIWEKPEGLRIAGLFILAIIAVSVASRVYRTTEVRVSHLELDEAALAMIRDAAEHDPVLRVIPNHPDTRDEEEYRTEGAQIRADHQMPEDAPLLFFEVYVTDPSAFSDRMRVCGTDVGGYKVLRAEAVAVPNAIAAFLLYLRDTTGRRPHCYFNWGESNPFQYLVKYLLSGQGDVAPVTREILRRVEKDTDKRPAVHVAV
jgi:hypothetical protein